MAPFLGVAPLDSDFDFLDDVETYSLDYVTTEIDMDSSLRALQDLRGYIFQDTISKRGHIDRLTGTIVEYIDSRLTTAQRLSDFLGLPTMFNGNNVSFPSYYSKHFVYSPHAMYASALDGAF